MIIYFDTSVIIPSLAKDHELHAKAKQLVVDAFHNGTAVTTTLHAYAEVYNTVTRQGKNRFNVSPEVAEKVLISGIGQKLTMVELAIEDYEAAIARCRELKLTGPIIYDALHYQAAIKAGADVLYTDNLKDFMRLQLPNDELKVKGVR